MAVQEARYSEEADWNVLYIDGEWVTPDRGTIDVMNPSTQEKFAEVPAGQPSDVEAAFDAAVEAQKEWRDTPLEERKEVIQQAVDVMKDRRQEVMNLLAVEAGSTTAKQMAEYETARQTIEYWANLDEDMVADEERESGFVGKTSRIVKEPQGVVAVIPPWNFPFHLAIRSIPPALALGNSVVLKPASETPISGGLSLASIFDETDLPNGLLNVVTGKGSTIGDDIAGNPKADVLAFTGSTDIGRRVARLAADQVNPAALELGGNAPYVVTEDVDLDEVVTAGLFGSFLHQGQVCISINRHLVHEDIYDDYVEEFTRRASELPIGDPQDPSNLIGPIINESQRDKIINFIEESVEQGATLETGGDYDGLFVEPTVLSDATNEMSASCNEHFGPVAPIIPFSSDEEAIRIANDTEHGLSSAVRCDDLERARELADQIEAGMVHINDQPLHEEANMPFGGVKMSGMGRGFHGEWILDEFTQTKWISEQHEPRDYLVF